MQPGVPTKRKAMLREEAMSDKPIVGIDVSKDWLDIATAGGSVHRIDNLAEAIEAWLDRTSPGLAAFEPTGGYERALIAILRKRDILFVRTHPNDIIAYRKSRGIKAKTDKIDARLIAAFAADELVRRGLRPAIATDDVLKELAARRRQLIATLHAERCRLALAVGQAVRQSLELVVDALSKSLRSLEAEIARHLDADPQTKDLVRLLRSLRGVGPVVAMTLLADLPELGHLSGKQVAALVGLAPQTRQSGKTNGRDRIGHGRPAVRAVLFNAARSAIARPSPFKAFYDHLVIDNHRPGKVALVAVMRKILVTANAIARDHQPWRLAA